MADETKGTQQDPLSKGQASTEDKGTTSQENRTYTQAELDKLLSDAKAASGRELAKITKERDGLSTRIKTLEDDTFNLQQTLSEYERLKEEAELASAEGNPDALKTIQRERKLRELDAQIKKDRAEIEKQRQEIADDVQAVSEWRREKLRTKVAQAYGITAEALNKPYLDTEEAMEDFAKTISHSSPSDNGDKEETKLDSGATTGSGGFRYDPKNPDATVAEGLKKMKKK